MVSKPYGDVIGVNLEQSDTVATHKLGARTKLDDGGYAVYLKANTAITGEGYVVGVDNAFGCDHMTTTLAGTIGRGAQVGVAQCAHAALAYGWFVVHGKTRIQTAGAVALGNEITTTATAGNVDDATTTGLVVIDGMFVDGTAIGSATLGNAILRNASVGRTL